MRFFIPYSAPQTISFAPNPELSDSTAPRPRVNIRPMMDGSTRTIISTTDRERLGLTFVLWEPKAAELREVIRQHRNDEWGMDLHDSRTFRGYLMSNPVSFVNVGKNRVEITLEFQGTVV